MRTSYKTLTTDEYNVLQVISSRTKNDCWFWLKQDKNGTDYVWDLEEQRRLCLKTGVSWLVEGVDCQENYNNCWLNAFEDISFRNLLKKLNIEFNVAYDGPSIIGMSMQDFIKYCKENNVKFKKYRDEFLVGDMIYQFSCDGKCFGFVTLNLDKDMRLEARRGIDEQISAAENIRTSNDANGLSCSRDAINTDKGR